MSRALREPVELGPALLEVGALAFLRLLAHVIEERRVAGELLDAGESVVGRVERRLQHAQRERAVPEHLPTPRDRLDLELLERDDLVHEAHVERLLRVVFVAQEPDLTRLLLADAAGEEARAVATVERADLGPGLAEPCVVGGDREVAHDVQDVPAADRVAGDHRDHWLGEPADLDLEVEDVQAADAVVADVAVIAADPLVATRAERLRAFTGEHDHAHPGVVAGALEGVLELEERAGPEGVADLGPTDRDLGDSLGELVADVAVLGVGARLPVERRSDAPVHGRLHSGSVHSYEPYGSAGLWAETKPDAETVGAAGALSGRS